MILAAALIVAGTLLWCTQTLVRALLAARGEAARARQAQLLQTFAAGVASLQTDPASLLAWQPLARAARHLLPDDFAALDRAAGAAFPFTRADIEAAHARWTAEWLAWEQGHDAEFKLKASVAEHDLTVSGGSPVMRARADAIEREKLDRYQRRYEAYIRTAKALQALMEQKGPEIA
jgi:hypothetical protein